MAVVAASNNHVLIFSPNSYEWPPLNEQYSRSMQETILVRDVDCDNSNSQRSQAVLSFHTCITSQVEPQKSCSDNVGDNTLDVDADTQTTRTGNSLCEANSSNTFDDHSQGIVTFTDLAIESVIPESADRLAPPECPNDTPYYLDNISVLHNADDLETKSHVPEQNNEETAGNISSEQNNEETAGNISSEQNNEETAGNTCDEQNNEETAGNTYSKKKKRLKKVRRKTIKKWKPCSNAELGFHISLKSSFIDDTTNLEKDCAEEDSSEGNEDSCEGNGDPCEGNGDPCEGKEACCEGNRDPCEGDTSQAEPAEVNICEASSNSTAQDDINFFLDLGIDVVNYTSQDDVQDWDGVYLSAPSEYTSCHVLDNKKSSHLKSKPAKRINSQTNTSQKAASKTDRLSRPETLYTFQLPAFEFSKIKKSDKYKLFELECSSTKRIYIRRDHHRKKEKIHKAVKSKNCRSVFNNNGRKRMYMHHRLIKMHNLNLDFRGSVKSYRSPAMPKSTVAVDVAKVVFRVDRKAQARDAVPPVQSLNHALHETNCAVGIEGDLANFLISLQHRDLTPEDYDMLLRLDDSVKPKTLSENILERLRTEKIGPNGPEQGAGDWEPLCTICMEPYVTGQERKFLPCDHDFHTECIDKWLKNSSMNCPLDGLPVEAS